MTARKVLGLELFLCEPEFTAVQNFFREAKFLVLLGEQGECKVVVLR